MQTCDVAIAGGGIIGAACAYQLSLAGLRVVLVEPNAVGSGATSLSYGSLSVQSDIPGQMELTCYGMRLWDKLTEFLPPDCEYRRCGTVWLVSDEKHLPILARRAELLTGQGVQTELLDNDQLAEAEPGLTHDLAGGLLLADDGCLRAGRAAAFLWQLASQKGVQHMAQRAVSFQNRELKLEDGSILYAGNMLNAGGKDASSLMPGLPLSYSKGHLLAVETRAICTIHQLAMVNVKQLSDPAGQLRLEARQNPPGLNQASEVWIGSSSQPTTEEAFTSAVEPKMVAHLLRRAIETIPAIGSAKPLRSWTGLRFTASDGLPMIGRVPGQEGVFAAVGHGAAGATTALATARLIADELLCQTSEIDPKPFRADRFEGTQAIVAKQF